jgi:hypothetical protein
VIANSVQALGDISVDTTGALLMKEQGRIISTEGDIALVSGDTQALGLLSAEEGEVRLNSGAAIVDVNDTSDPNLNIQAERFHARAVSGIGSFNALELEVKELDVINQGDSVALTNFVPLTVDRLRNDGDISLTNTGDVTFIKESVNTFFATEEPRYPDSPEITPASGSSFNFVLNSGNIKTDGTLVLTEPHIAAFKVNITNPHGVFFPPSPVIYAPKEISITSGRSRNSPYYAFKRPDDINDETKYYGDVVGAGEQLIEVETLADIDPAVFTQVKNYFYQEVSIRLPSDQLYEEE